jgi:hypothetical protein
MFDPPGEDVDIDTARLDAWVDEGRTLATQLRSELGDAVEVIYHLDKRE